MKPVQGQVASFSGKASVEVLLSAVVSVCVPVVLSAAVLAVVVL